MALTFMNFASIVAALITEKYLIGDKKMFYRARVISLLVFCFFACFTQYALSQETPNPSPTPAQKGVVNGKAISLAKPVYPPEASALRIGGIVQVRVTVDENGNVISAKAETGNRIFHKVAEEAALKSKFSPTLLDGTPVKVTATINFKFIEPLDWENIAWNLGSIEAGVSAVGTRVNTNNTLEGFEDEINEYYLLTSKESTEGMPPRATKLINSIQSKLKTLHPAEYWYFKLGLTESRLSHHLKTGGEEGFKSHLPELMELYNSAPYGIPKERMGALSKAIEISMKVPLTEKDRKNIINVLIKGFNEVRSKKPEN